MSALGRSLAALIAVVALAVLPYAINEVSLLRQSYQAAKRAHKAQWMKSKA